MADLRAGDRVRFAADYLRSIADYSAYTASWIGTVDGVAGDRVSVRWDHEPTLPTFGRGSQLEIAEDEQPAATGRCHHERR